MASGLQFSLASAQVETKLALAQFNFDFSLVKREAPTEYREIGTHISTKRRNAAESGTIHKTAQRLSVLFRSTLPKTPALIKGYGLRCSEISKQLGDTSKLQQIRGVFQDHIGLDTTSLYAAATSSDTAIAVHLLACLLARMFEARDAVAIWEELIASHKAKISNSVDDVMELERAAIAAMDIQHGHLQEWDNSARAWLLSVDKLPELAKKHTQLKLIVNNIGHVRIDHQSSPYESVLNAWKTALETMDRVIGGASFAITNGAVLTAVSAWHLYPDVFVLGSPGQLIKQEDALLSQAGRLTIGFQSTTIRDPGVYWSLPLSYLRYYGPPVIASGSWKIVPTRLTIEQLLHAALGCTFRSWNVPVSDFEDCARLITLVAKCCFDTPLSELGPLIDECDSTLQWFAPLAYAANSYHQSTNEHRTQIERLIKMGFKRPSLIISKQDLRKSRHNVLFMRKFEFFDWIADQDSWSRVMRETLQHMPTSHSHGLIIRRVQSNDHTRSEQLECLHPRVFTNGRRLLLRWIVNDNGNADTSPMTNNEVDVHDQNIASSDLSFLRFTNSLIWKNCPEDLIKPALDCSSSPAGQIPSSPDWRLGQVRSDTSTSPTTEIYYNLLVGSSDSISLLAQRNSKTVDEDLLDKYSPPLKNLIPLMESNVCDPALVKICISSKSNNNGVVRALRVLSFVTQLYVHLPGATVAARVFDNDALCFGHFYERTFEPARLGEEEYFVRANRRHLALEIIATLESGHQASQIMQNTFAISIHDSIYMAEELFDDPGEQDNNRYIRRIFGNIGEPGLVLLTEPFNPQIRKAKAEEWNIVSHDPFNGHWEDNFVGTSLHLRFTGWKMPITVSVDGGSRFTSTNMMEAVVSVYDTNTWVGDLDLKLCLSRYWRQDIVFVVCSCANPMTNAPVTCPDGLVCIDTWPELLNAPLEAGVIRAHGNSEARLAASIVARMKGHPTVLFGKDKCWKCAQQLLDDYLSRVKSVKHSIETHNSGLSRNKSTSGIGSSVDMHDESKSDDEIEELNNDEADDSLEEKVPIYIL